MKISELFNSKQIFKNNNSTQPISDLYTPQKAVAAPPSQPYTLKKRGATVTDTDIEALRPLLYGEVSNRNTEKKKLEADVIFNTALNRQKEYARKGQNKTIAEILAMPNQYQAYGSPQYKEYHAPANTLSVAKKKEIDAIVDTIKERVKKGDFKDNTEGAYYYIHNAKDNSITYDNLRKLFAN